MVRYVSGPTSGGPDACAVTRPRRGVVDELVWESLCFSAPVGYRPLFLDLHVPRAFEGGDDRLCPLVVWIHGGGWESGSRRRFPVSIEEHWFLQRVLLAGFAVALVDYRLCAEACFPAPVDDVCAALGWLDGHADDFGYDVTRLVLWGESAGGHLALLAAARRGCSPAVAAVVDWYAPTDLAALLASRTSAVEAGGEPPTSPGIQQVMEAGGWDVAAASPVRVLGADAPPVFIAHGRDDKTVPISQSELLRDHLTALGATVEYHETAGGHVFDGADVLVDVIGSSLEFLGRHLAFDAGPHRGPGLARADNTVGDGRTPSSPARATAQGLSITGAGGRAISMRIQRPAAGADTVVMYLHGGSVTPDSAPPLATRLCAAVPATVVHVDHPPGQELPFPAAYDHCVTAATWMHDNLESLGARRLVLAGDGDGGGLAAATALHCRDHGIPVAALFVNYPLVDRATGSSTGRPTIRLGGEGPGTGPAVSPALADLRGLCPVLCGIGAHDPRFEETLGLVRRLEEAAVPTRLRIFPMLGHGYCTTAPVSEAAERATEQLSRDLHQLLWDGTLA